MATHEVDDRSSEVTYSQPRSGHHWSPVGSMESHGQTLTLTRTRGATARITFQGTRIQVMGLVSPEGTGGAPASTYGIDSRPPYRFTTTQDPSSTRARVLFYDSGELDMGSHTLIVTNDVEGSFFWIDSFIVTENPESEPEAPPVPPPVVSTPSGGASTPASETNQAALTQPTRLDTPSASQAPSPNTSQSTSASPLEGIDTPAWEGGIKIIVTTRDSAPSGSTSAVVSTGRSETSNSVNVGAVVGGVLGGLIIVLLSTVIFLLLRKNRKKKALLPVRDAEQFSAGEGSRTPSSSNPTAIPARFESEKRVHHPQTSVSSTPTLTTDSSRFSAMLGGLPPPSYQQSQDQGNPRIQQGVTTDL